MFTKETKSWKKAKEESKSKKKLKKQMKLLQSLENGVNDCADNSINDTDAEVKVECTENCNTRPRPSTISLAVPGSILENAQTEELRTYLAGQIARAACIFRIDEIVVFDDGEYREVKNIKKLVDNVDDEDADKSTNANRTVHRSCLQMARILQYLECPQYLRKFFFPLHKDLKYSGLLNPLDAPHHLRQQNVFRYRDGIVTEKTGKSGHSYVNVGLMKPVLLNKLLTPGLRVTVKLTNPQDTSKKQYGTVVSPYEPRHETGVYWGYQVRVANSISEIFTKSPYRDGYDVTIGTSDRGKSVEELAHKSIEYNHLLLVFGGLQGLEYALSNDDRLEIDDPQLLFDHYVNVLPKQGCRTIRTEEAILIALTSLQSKIEPNYHDVECELIKEALPQSSETGAGITSNNHSKKQ